MTFEDALDEYGLTPAADALPAIRRVLREQSAKEQAAQGQGDTELMKVCCVQLFAHGDVADALLIWKAKRSSMDADASIDVQLLCGAGLQATKEFLRQQPLPEAAAALARIQACEASGDFEGFSVAQVMAFYEDYYSED